MVDMAADNFASRWRTQRSLLQKVGLLPSARRGRARSCARQAFTVILLIVMTAFAWRSRVGGAIRPEDNRLKGSSEDASTIDMTSVLSAPKPKSSRLKGSSVETSGANEEISSSEKESDPSESTDTLEAPPSLTEGSTIKVRPGTNVNVGEISLPHEKSHVSEPAACEPTPPSNATVFKSIWVPSYPGSGSEMLRGLVVAITGLHASNIYESGSKRYPEKCFGGTAVTCETHWPVLFEQVSPDRYKLKAHPSAVILFQNPADALPSYVNFQYEKFKTEEFQSSQAPEHAWRQWRDDKFDEQIELWKDVLLRWHEELSYNIALHLPYEQLTDESTGPALLHKLTTVFRDIGSPVAEDGDLACLWRRVFVERAGETRKARDYTPGFRPEQKARMLGVLKEVMEKLANQAELVDVLTSYEKDITNNLRVE